MDELSWGNTRFVVSEGKDEKVIINEDEKFVESTILATKVNVLDRPQPASRCPSSD
jgi:hypothetical protein